MDPFGSFNVLPWPEKKRGLSQVIACMPQGRCLPPGDKEMTGEDDGIFAARAANDGLDRIG